MKAPVGLLSDRTVLRSKMDGPCPDKFHFYAKESRLCKPCAETPLIRANVQTVCRKCAAAFLHKERTPNLTIWRSKFGAPPGTRTLGPLIKRNQRATIVNSQNYADSLFLSIYRKFAFCICCIPCTCYPLLHPLSSRSGVQKVCKNVQSQNQPLKTGIEFLCKARKPAGFEPETAATILSV